MAQPTTESMARMEAAHHAIMLEDARALLRADRENTADYRRNMAKINSTAESDSMLVVGDVTLQQTPPPAKPSILPSLAKMALGAGLAATGVGAGLGLPLAGYEIAKAILNRPAAVAPDTDTTLDIQLVPPDR